MGTHFPPLKPPAVFFSHKAAKRFDLRFGSSARSEIRDVNRDVLISTTCGGGVGSGEGRAGSGEGGVGRGERGGESGDGGGMSCKSNRDAFMHVRLMTRVRNDIQYKFDNGNQQKSYKTSNKLKLRALTIQNQSYGFRGPLEQELHVSHSPPTLRGAAAWRGGDVCISGYGSETQQKLCH